MIPNHKPKKRSPLKRLKAAFMFFIKNLKYKITTTKKERELHIITQKLEGAAARNQIKKDLLKYDILVFIRKKLNLTRKSRFIPFTLKNKVEIKGMVEHRFGEAMKKHGVELTDNLELH